MELIGHDKTKEQIKVAIESAKRRNTAPPHMLFSGHPGCGKTSMAKEVANILGTDFISIIPETLNNQKAIMELLDSLNAEGYNERGDRIDQIKPTVVFIDECHRLPMFGQEKLGIAMENFTMETGSANQVYWIPYFTVIGATTLSGELSPPFLARFKLNFFFEPYSASESCEIVKLHAKKLNISITEKAVRDIAKRGRGVPRIIVSYLERCRDMMYALNSEIITSKLTEHTFENIGIDQEGFNRIELKILKTLYNADKPLGLETLSLITGESSKTIKNDIETYLIRNEYMIRSGSGRQITQKGITYLESKGYIGKKVGRVAIPADYIRK